MDEYIMDERLVAVHEAGHVAMFLTHRVGFNFTNIIEKEEEDGSSYLGVVQSYEAFGRHMCEVKDLRPLVVVDASGCRHTAQRIRTIPLTKIQKEENIISCKISLGGILAEQVTVGSAGDWMSWRDTPGTDISHILGCLAYNMVTEERSIIPKEEVAEALAELKAETMPLFMDSNGSVTDLWAKCCRISDALYSRRTLTFRECWMLYDGLELSPKHLGFGVYQK